MRALGTAVEIGSGLCYLGLMAVLCLLNQTVGEGGQTLFQLGVVLLAVLFADQQIRRRWSERIRAEADAERLAALRAYSDIRAETLNLCAGIAVSLSLCSHYCFSDPRKTDAELNRLWGALEEFRNVRLSQADRALLAPPTPPAYGRRSAAARPSPSP